MHSSKRWAELKQHFLSLAVKEEAANPSRGWNEIWHEYYWKLWDKFHEEYPELKPSVEPGIRWKAAA